MNFSVKKLEQTLLRPVDASSLGLFRVLFGLLMCAQVFFCFDGNFVAENFSKAHFHFPFRLFEVLHLPYLTPLAANLLFQIMGIATLGIAAGLCFRLSIVIFLSGFLYMFLSEKSLSNDYYYLILLISFLLCFTGANQWPALNNLRLRTIKDQTVPFWQILILRLQFIIIYFYSTLSKASYDWLVLAQPLRHMLSGRELFGFPLNELWIAYFLSYAAIILDFLIVVLLLAGRHRWMAFLCIFIFNGTNMFLFNDIELFPFLMLAAIPIFLDPDQPRRFFAKIGNSWGRSKTEEARGQKQLSMSPRCGNIVCLFLCGYLGIQILVPLRHWMYPQNPAWSYEGSRFSWRLKINMKLVKMDIVVKDPRTQRIFHISHQKFVTPRQLWLDNIPDMLLQFVQQLEGEMKKLGVKNPQIQVDAVASLNNRPFQTYIDPRFDLLKEKYPLFSHARWIAPLHNDAGF